MKKLILLIFTFLLYQNQFAEQGWSVQSIRSFSDIYFINNNIGYAAGEGFTIFKTEDGGESWENLNSGIDYEQYAGGGALFFTDSQNGWFVASKKTILRTTSSGNSWKTIDCGYPLSPSQFLHFTNAFFIDSNIGWVIGYLGNINGSPYVGVLLKTTDGGDTWISKEFSEVIYAAYFTSVTNGYIVGAAGKIYNTINGGTTWTQQSTGTNEGIFDIKFRNELDGIAIGVAGSILVTTNSGTTWIIKHNTGTGLRSLTYSGSSIWYAIGNGKLYKSNDNGDTWTLKKEFSDFNINKVFFHSNTIGWYASSSGCIGKTTNSGDDWFNTTPTSPTNKIFALSSPLNIWGLQDNGIIHSTDGKKWKYYESNLLNNINDVYFKNPLIGFAVGGFNLNTKFLRTTDAGKSWESISLGISENLNSIFFADTSFGWIVGTNGLIMQTLDGGETWGMQNSTTSAHLNDVIFYNSQVGYAVGKSTYGPLTGKNIILRTLNSGLLWEIVYAGSIQGEFKKIACFDSSTIVIQNDSYLLKSVDGGITINTLYNNSTVYIKDFYFTDLYTGWFASPNGIYKTNTGGSSWIQNLNISSNSLFFITPIKGWVITDNAVLFTDNGGISEVRVEENYVSLPTEFELYQNFPNPFNPSTTISFSLPITSNVKLAIYDITGSIVCELVNEVLNSGKYSVTWNGKNHKGNGVSSGVYLYQFSVNGVNKTKKMLLLK